MENLFMRNLLFGISTGFLYFPGKLSGMNHSYNVPFMVKAGYRFTVFNKLSVVPEFAAGISYNRVEYSNTGMEGIPGYGSEAINFEITGDLI